MKKIRRKKNPIVKIGKFSHKTKEVKNISIFILSIHLGREISPRDANGKFVI